jgi:hypothetical protein
MELLRSANLDPLQATLYPRPTPFANLAEWVHFFGKKFLEGINPDDVQELVDEVVARCRESGACHWDEEKSSWYIDYVRLRIVAVKGGGDVGGNVTMTIYILSSSSFNLQNHPDSCKQIAQFSGLYNIFNGSRTAGASCRPPCCQNKVGNIFNSFAFLDAAEDGWTVSSHQF